jgi:hypothetical protein
MLINANRNLVVLGERHHASLEEIDEFLKAARAASEPQEKRAGLFQCDKAISFSALRNSSGSGDIRRDPPGPPRG